MQSAVRRSKSDLEKAQTRAGYLFILPSFTLYAVFVLAPVVLTFVLSFTYYDPMAGSRWVGLENFERFFTGDRSLQIFWNTLCFAIFAVAGNVTVGLLLALALNRAMPLFLLYLFRLAYFLPVIIAAAFVSIVWGYFYGDDLGVINYYLIRLGFAPVHWLTSSRTGRSFPDSPSIGLPASLFFPGISARSMVGDCYLVSICVDSVLSQCRDTLLHR